MKNLGDTKVLLNSGTASDECEMFVDYQIIYDRVSEETQVEVTRLAFALPSGTHFVIYYGEVSQLSPDLYHELQEVARSDAGI